MEDGLCSEHGVHDVCESCFKIRKVLVAFPPPKGAESWSSADLGGGFGTLASHPVPSQQQAPRRAFNLLQPLDGGV